MFCGLGPMVKVMIRRGSQSHQTTTTAFLRYCDAVTASNLGDLYLSFDVKSLSTQSAILRMASSLNEMTMTSWKLACRTFQMTISLNGLACIFWSVNRALRSAMTFCLYAWLVVVTTSATVADLVNKPLSHMHHVTWYSGRLCSPSVHWMSRLCCSSLAVMAAWQ